MDNKDFKKNEIIYIKENSIDKLDHNFLKLINWVNSNYEEEIIDIVYLLLNYKKAYLIYQEAKWNKKISPTHIKLMNRVDDIIKKLKLGSIKSINLPDLFKELKIIERNTIE